MPPKFSVSVVVAGNFQRAKPCLESIAAHSSDYELIVSDGSSDPATWKLLEEFARSIVPVPAYLVQNSELGANVPAAHDDALVRRATGEYRIALDSRAAVCDGWLDRIEGAFRERPALGLAFIRFAAKDGAGTALCFAARARIVAKLGFFLSGNGSVPHPLSARIQGSGHEVALLDLDRRVVLPLTQGEKDVQVAMSGTLPDSSTKGRATLGLAMIVRDEEKNLGRCLESVRDCFDEIVVVDTGSTDRTKQIAASFGAKIHDFVWIDDFSAARNFAFSKSSTDFTMWLDADDVLKPEDAARLMGLRRTLGQTDAYFMKYDYAQDEEGNSKCLFSRERIVRNTGEARWEAPAHEAMILPDHWRKDLRTGVTVTHLRDPEDCAKDAGRNLRILRKAVLERPADTRLQFYLACELTDAGEHDEATMVFEDYLRKDDSHENRVHAHIRLAEAHHLSGRPEKAIETCLKGIQFDHRWAEFYVMIGRIHYERHEWKKAIFWLEQAASRGIPDSTGFVAPQNYTWVPQDMLCACYWKIGDVWRSYRANAEALRHKPKEPRFLNNHETMGNLLWPGRRADRPVRINLVAGGTVPGYHPLGAAAAPGIDECLDHGGIPYADSTVHAIMVDGLAGDGSQRERRLREWKRMLRPFGELTVRVPDLERLSKTYAADGRGDDWWRSAMGAGFSKDGLCSLLERCGFEVLQVSERGWQNPPSIEARARLASKPARVKWLLSTSGTASSDRWSRAHTYLSGKGVDSALVSIEGDTKDKGSFFQDLKRSEVVVLAAAGPSERALMERLRRSGVSVVFDLVDAPDQGTLDDCLAHSSVVVSPTPGLVERARASARVLLIPDNSEGSEEGEELWLSLVEGLARENSSPPKVDIVIPTHDNLKHLKPCVESVLRQTDWPCNVIVVDSGDGDAAQEWLAAQGEITLIRKAGLSRSQALNHGLRESKERYVVLLDDETIVSRHWLPAMMAEAMVPGIGAVGPFSNHGIPDEPIVVAGRDIRKASTFEDVAGILREIEAHCRPKKVVERPWIAFSTVLLARKAVEDVGFLDETSKGHEDYDYCQRLRKAGYRIMSVHDSFVFHFNRTPQATDARVPAVAAPGSDKPVFAMYTGPAWERWNAASLENEGLGGSETAAVYISRAFAKKGYRSLVFGDCKDREGTFEGVEYLDWSRFDRWADSSRMDIFVSCRLPEVFGRPIQAEYKICLATDTAFHTDDVHADRIDRFFAISPPHRDLLAARYRIPPEKIFVTRCGVDLARFEGSAPRDRAKLVYTSAPNRGLDILLGLFPKIREAFTDATLHVFYGWNYLQEAARRGDRGLAEFIQSTRGSLKQPGVVFRGRVPLAELTKELLSSSLWAYPTHFHENFCISALEAMAAGVPVVTSDWAAMPSTVGDAGVLVPGDPRSREYQERFLQECLSMLGDRARWERHSAMGRERAMLFPWSTIADEWLEAIDGDLAARKTAAVR